jgi:ATP-dependent helicase/nuclease subunit B
MALELLFGRASADAELALLERIREIQASDDQAEIFYVVPNHIKFETEIRVLSRLAELNGKSGQILATPDLQVFSMTRLAWFYMNDDPVYRVSNLSANGYVMLVQRLLKLHQDDLEQYAGLLTKQGFIAQFASQLLELKQAGLTWETVEVMASRLGNAIVLQRKLHDLAVIGRALDAELAERNQYLASDLLLALRLYLKRGDKNYAHHYFFINGYSQMTSAERGVVEALIAVSGGVVIALPADDGAASMTAGAVSENDLFYKPKRLAQQLAAAATEAEVRVKASSIDEKRDVSQTYESVEQFWIDYEQRGVKQTAKYPAATDLAVWQMSSRFQEVEQLARFIRQEVATGKRRYRDFMLLTPDLSQYENILPAIFNRFEIPVFMDLDRPMNAHPLVAFLQKLLSLAPGYHIADVMALLKTELLLPEGVAPADYREALAITENYALAKNMTGWRWTNPSAWQYDYRVSESDDEVTRLRAADRDAQLALIHNQISMVVAPFIEGLRTAVDARDMARQLYNFLENQGIKQRLLSWRDAAVSKGNLWEAQQPEQVWRMFINVLDDFVTVFDHEELDLIAFQELLQAAFDGANYAGIPATMDQVRVSESGIVQNKGYHTVVIFGATAANLPATIRQRALLHDGDRSLLTGVLPENVFLRDTAEQEMAQESLAMYNAMMVGRERLIWTYATSDGEKRAQASTYVQRLVAQFHVGVHVFEPVPEPTETSRSIGNWVGSISSTIANLVLVNRRALQTQEALSPAWGALQQEVVRVASERLRHALSALTYQNVTEPVAPRLMTALFGDNLRTSISRLESYAKNPFEFFLQYGLRLQERQVLQLTPAEKGTLMHAVLEGSFAELIQNNQVLGALSDEQVRQLAQSVAEGILAADDPTYDIFKSTPRMDFLTHKLIDQVVLALLNMKRGQRPDMTVKTLGVEAGFGIGENPLAPISYDLTAGEVIVRGKVDRFDAVATPVGEFVTVMDYKSGTRDFNYAQAYEGLELQLMTYWSAMTKNLSQVDGKAEQVGAALFWSLQNPWVKASELPGANTLVELQAGAMTKALIAGKYRGLILENDALVDSLSGPDDEHVVPYAVKRNKNGAFAASSDVVSEDDLETLLLYTEAKTRQIAAKIFAGEFPLRPFRQGTTTGLQYTAYRPVMMFDAMMGDKYRDMLAKTAKKTDVLAMMQDFISEEGGQD